MVGYYPKMKYQLIRNQIQTGDLFFEKVGAGWVGKIISLITQSDIVHVGIFVVLAGRIFTVECRYGMRCRMMLASNRLKDFDFVKTHSMVYVDNVIADVGVTGYNVFGALLSWFTRLSSKSRTFCSEFVARKLDINFPHLGRGIYPIDLYNHYEKN